MKTTYILCACAIACAIALLSGSPTAKAADDKPAAAKKAPEQKLVRVFESYSMLMGGDPDEAKLTDGKVLPALLADGWRIVEVHTDAAGTDRLITTGYLLLER